MDYFYSENFTDIFFYSSLIFTLTFLLAASFFSPPYLKMSKSSSTRFYTRLFYKLAIVVSLNCIILGVWLIADWPSKLYALSNMPADIYEKNSKASFYIVVIFVYTILWPIFLLFLGYKQVRAFYLEHSLISKLETFEQTKIELLQRLDKEDKILTWDFRKGILVWVAVLLTFWIFLKLNHD